MRAALALNPVCSLAEGVLGCFWAAGAHPMAFCQMLCVLSEADVCMRLFAGIRTRPAVAGMAAGLGDGVFLRGLGSLGNRAAAVESNSLRCT